ncbi:hypothetical protein AVEN_104846-1 [Araneus ventricosus]|uniref:Uncharacterized protein n=1 Tax=Araneus ventricosus TaxID=182803 RepID=A0A4Y2NBN0_ARAVE|nr:hypothetical protein AVEN_104846-1 [Araneus ventricosus]
MKKRPSLDWHLMFELAYGTYKFDCLMEESRLWTGGAWVRDPIPSKILCASGPEAILNPSESYALSLANSGTWGK